jgi:hypothetical protein
VGDGPALFPCQCAAEMGGGACACRSKWHRLPVGPRVGNEFLQIVCRQVLARRAVEQNRSNLVALVRPSGSRSSQAKSERRNWPGMAALGAIWPGLCGLIWPGFSLRRTPGTASPFIRPRFARRRWLNIPQRSLARHHDCPATGVSQSSEPAVFRRRMGARMPAHAEGQRRQRQRDGQHVNR